MSQTNFAITNLEITDDTSLVIRESTTLYIDVLNKDCILTLPNATENPDLIFNILNTSIAHKLVVLDLITLNPSSGASFRSNGTIWETTDLNIESSYTIALKNGYTGPEVQYLSTLFSKTNTEINLSPEYRSQLNAKGANYEIPTYLEDETVIGYWMKNTTPIYRKCYDGELLRSGSYYFTELKDSVDFVLDCKGIIVNKNTSSNMIQNFPISYSNSYYWYWYSAYGLYMNTPSPNTYYNNIKIILEYVKLPQS